ncbi:MAG TPA: choice-of-anchor tandem repeat NxxGxxAF-containing protein, partial [Chthoniobacteraceae bacterium]
VAFVGSWTSSAGLGSGIFTGTDAYVLRVKEGDPALIGARFSSFKDPVLNSEGKIAFSATIISSGSPQAKRTGIFSDALTGELKLLALEGTPSVDGTMLKRIQSFSLQGAEVVYTASSGGGGRAAYRVTAEATKRVIRTGQPFGLTRVKSFNLLAAVPGSSAQNRAHRQGAASFSIRLADGTQALVDSAGEALSAFAYSGDYLGGTQLGDATWKSFGPVAAPDDKFAAVSAKLTIGVGGVTNDNATGIFLGSGTTFEPIALVDNTTGIGNTRFATFKDPVLAPESGQIAFLATLAGSGVTKSDDSTVWWRSADGPLTLLAREGGAPPDTEAGGQWQTFTSIGISGGASGGPLIYGSLRIASGGVTSSNDSGIWAVDTSGTLRLLTREGDLIGGKSIGRIEAFNTLGLPGVTRSFNNVGEVVYRAIFTDRSEAIMRVQIP